MDLLFRVFMITTMLVTIVAGISIGVYAGANAYLEVLTALGECR